MFIRRSGIALAAVAGLVSVRFRPEPDRCRAASTPAAVGRRGGPLAVAQNLGIRIERLNPEIQDVAIAQTRGAWVPSLLTSLNRTSTATAPTNPFAGGLNKITDSRLETSLGRHPGAADRRRLHADLEQLAALVEQLLPDLQSAAALEPRRSTSPSRCSATSRSTTPGSSSRSTARSARTATRRCSRRSRRPCATSRTPTGIWRSRSTTSTRSASRSISPSGCSPTTRSACRSARWRRSTSSRRSRKSRGTTSR